MPSGLRSSRRTPRICSRFAIAADTAGCVMASWRAALPMPPDLTTVERMYKSRTRRRRPRRLSHSIVTEVIRSLYEIRRRFRVPLISLRAQGFNRHSTSLVQSRGSAQGGSAMQLVRREFLRLTAATVAAPALLQSAWAQSYPSRPVRIIVGYAAGGATDVVARLIGQWLSERLGQPFVVENR